MDDRGVWITLHINQEDMGYVIGRQDQTARALRIRLKTVGAKEDARVNLKIYEPDELRRQHQEGKVSRPAAPRAMPDGRQESRDDRPPARHGEAGMVSDQDLADLGI